MKFLTNQSCFNSFRNSISSCRFLYSVSVCLNPSIFSGEDNHLPLPFDPLQFFADKSSSRHCTLETTRILHAVLLRRHFFPHDVFVAKSLLTWYSKSASMVDALKLFDTIPQPDVVSCNIMISGYNQRDLFEDSWGFFRLMRFLGFELNEITYRCVLSACTAMQAPLLTKLVHSDAIKTGYASNDTVRSALIDAFSKNDCFEYAYRLFRDASCCDVYSWNVVIGGALRNRDYGIVLDLFREMCFGFYTPDAHTHSSVLAACAALEELTFGKAVQAQVIKCAAEDVVVSTAVVDLYAKCGRVAEAWKAFSLIPNPNVVSWTALLSGCRKDDDGFSSLVVFKKMRKLGIEINSLTVTSVMASCAKPSMFCEAIQIHAWVLKSGFHNNPTVTSALISMYSKIGDIDLFELVFEESEHVQNSDLGNVMVSSFSQNRKPDRAIKLFTRMLQKGFKPDQFSVCSLLSAIDCFSLGNQIHSHILKNGLVNLSVGSSLFTMYSKCGHLEDSFKVYQEMPVRDDVCWTSMISGFSEHGYHSEAIRLFKAMLSEGTVPDETTLSAALTACSSLCSLQSGKEIHAYALRAELEKGPLLGSSLVNMYSKCGSLKSARLVYDRLPEIDIASCSSLISGYSQQGLVQHGFQVFREMIMSDFAVDSFTVSSILGAVTHSSISSLGAQIHAYITKIGLSTELSVGTSLVKMYSKFGSIEECSKAFSQIHEPDLIAWTTLIASYAQHGKAIEALQVYDLMKENGIKPDKVTFVEILSSCSHGGLVEEAYVLLNSMAKDYGIVPEIRHYVSLVDALGRSGRLKEAERFINNMPIKPNALVWGTLLAACKLHGDVELATLAAKKVIELEPSDSGAYISLSNVLAEVGEWDEVEEIRNLMRRVGVRKEPGWSSI